MAAVDDGGRHGHGSSLGEAADTMVELCMMRGLCLKIYIRIVILYKILR